MATRSSLGFLDFPAELHLKTYGLLFVLDEAELDDDDQTVLQKKVIL